MKRTAALTPSTPYAVRIVWVSSLLQFGAPAGAMLFDEQGTPRVQKKTMENYMVSKVGESWLASQFATRLDAAGIMSVVSQTNLLNVMPDS